MADPKPFASLTSGLLARKGAATPAMRRQAMTGFGTQDIAPGHDDLGWNDMGDDAARSEDDKITSGLTPMPAAVAPVQIAQVDAEAPVPVVVEQQRALRQKVADSHRAIDAGAVLAATPRKPKAAFTLRLDPERHLRLRLACAVDNRSAQQIVTEALDAFLNSQPEIDVLADRVPRVGTGK